MDAPVATHQYAETDIEMQFEPLEVTPEPLLGGVTLWGAPLSDRVASRLSDGIAGLLELPWDAWPTTLQVTQISMSTEPITLPTAWDRRNGRWRA
jgi:hypothetical protein